MASAIKNVTGVVDTACLFVMMTERVHVAGPNGVKPTSAPCECSPISFTRVNLPYFLEVKKLKRRGRFA